MPVNSCVHRKKVKVDIMSNMKLIFKLILTIFLGCGIISLIYARTDRELDQEEIRLHYLTDWQIEPSLKYDALCLLNTLSGDPFYLKYYQSEYEEFKKKLTKSVKKSLSSLKQKIKDENKNIISTFLCLFFSATDDRTLDNLLNTIENSKRLKGDLEKSPYYSQESWHLYKSVQEDLKIVFLFLKDIQFESYWKKYILPRAKEKIKKIQRELPKYNVAAEVEAHLGFKLPSHKITVYLLYFSKPHVIRITGTRFLTNLAWPFEIIVRNAVHEMMHPPYDLAHDGLLKKAIYLLKKDEFLMDKVLNHNPAYGYNSFAAFIEEDCVQAIEQIINEKLKVAIEAHKRWKETDEGMHVFAVALYRVMKEKNFNQKGELFRDFLIRIIRSGDLAPGRIKTIYDAFYCQSD